MKTLLSLALSIVSVPALSQAPEMADQMRSEGKIYVVVAIILVVLVGLIGYLFFVDRKVTRLEEQKNRMA
jgi:hypothetical protein